MGIEGVLADHLSTLGPTGLLVLCVLFILTGRLVPGKERDYWREAFFEEQRQKRELMETGRVTRDVLRALPDPSSQQPEEVG